MHRNSLGLLVVLVIFLIFTPILHSLVTAKNTQEESDLPDAINYLVVNYNSTVGLIPEVPHGNTYWLYSDNFLAFLALEHYNNQYPGNLTVTNIAANIEGNLSKYIAEVPNVNLLNQYMVLNTSSKTLNPSIFNASSSYTVAKDFGAIINITLNNGTNTNTETTSLAILALLPTTATASSTPEFPTFLAVAIVLIATIAVGILFYKKRSTFNL